MTALAESIAIRLGWSEERLALLHVGGPLHDIGKLAISDEVLSKPGRLDDDELAQIREHPKLGARLLLRDRGFPQGAAVRALPPRALGRDRLPDRPRRRGDPGRGASARVADAFDAMTSDRPYRRALSREEALAEVERCAGTQFDPEIVRVFLGLLPRPSGYAAAGRLLAERRPDLELRARAADHLVGELARAGVAAEVGRADAVRDRLEARLADRPRRRPVPPRPRSTSSAAPARIIAIGLATFLP